jgi:hypothetical protein
VYIDLRKMDEKMLIKQNWLLLIPVLFLFTIAPAINIEAADEHTVFNGSWVVNEELSDDTDYQVERAIKEAGGRLPNTGKKGKGRYKGGPKEHAIYDHISYDEKLLFTYTSPKFHLQYEEGFERIFYSDNRKRVISASGTISGDNQDFSFASWDENILLVESRARDGGRILETFELDAVTNQLKITLEIKPSSFEVPIYVTRIYDKYQATE